MAWRRNESILSPAGFSVKRIVEPDLYACAALYSSTGDRPDSPHAYRNSLRHYLTKAPRAPFAYEGYSFRNARRFHLRGTSSIRNCLLLTTKPCLLERQPYRPLTKAIPPDCACAFRADPFPTPDSLTLDCEEMLYEGVIWCSANKSVLPPVAASVSVAWSMEKPRTRKERGLPIDSPSRSSSAHGYPSPSGDANREGTAF